MKTYEITFTLYYKNRTSIGNKLRVKNCINKANAESKFWPYIHRKYKNTNNIEIINTEEYINSEKDLPDIFKDIFGDI